LESSKSKAIPQDERTLSEVTSGGLSTGLETEGVDETDVITTPFDPKLIDVITQGRTVGQLIDRLEHEEMNLSPDFQRRANLWKDDRKSGLIESMLLRIPIPSLYVSEDKDGNYEVVDGLQRLCAIAHFVNVASLNKEVNAKLDPLRLTKMNSLIDLNGSTFEELPRPLKRRINETELTLHIIRAGTPKNVKFEVFSRINRSGLPLKAQEIRNALYPGRWRQEIRDIAGSASFLEATEHKIKAERLEDYELILRFAALYTSEGARLTDENLDDFLNDFVENICGKWGDKKWEKIRSAFNKSMQYAPKIFGRYAFRKYYGDDYRNPINRGLFEAQSAALAHRNAQELDKLSNNRKVVLNKLAHEMNNNDSFINSLLYATGRGSSSNARLVAINKILDEALDA